ncbi:hypothetical protein IWX90DRAFT_272122 [Phyllosticta citrichinensis]|uniref:Secreted protein n=1 Tax=Phyllosticta citrichinensis TaxID=1130410 RepID=A0ABR1XMY2_9PEZI
MIAAGPMYAARSAVLLSPVVLLAEAACICLGVELIFSPLCAAASPESPPTVVVRSHEVRGLVCKTPSQALPHRPSGIVMHPSACGLQPLELLHVLALRFRATGQPPAVHPATFVAVAQRQRPYDTRLRVILRIMSCPKTPKKRG